MCFVLFCGSHILYGDSRTAGGIHLYRKPHYSLLYSRDARRTRDRERCTASPPRPRGRAPRCARTAPAGAAGGQSGHSGLSSLINRNTVTLNTACGTQGHHPLQE